MTPDGAGFSFLVFSSSLFWDIPSDWSLLQSEARYYVINFDYKV